MSEWNLFKKSNSSVNSQSRWAHQVGGLKITRAIQQTQARKHFHCFRSGFCLHFVRFTSRKNKGEKKRNPLWFKAPNVFPVIITLIGIYFKMSLTLNPYCYEQKTDLCLCFLLCSLAMRREKKKKNHEATAEQQTDSLASVASLPLCLSAWPLGCRGQWFTCTNCIMIQTWSTCPSQGETDKG